MYASSLLPFARFMTKSVKRKTKRKKPTELSWVLKNQEQVNHINFFDFFLTYSRQTVTRRFKFIVNYCFEDSKKEKLINDFDNWKKTKEAKLYWERREVKVATIESSNEYIFNETNAIDNIVSTTETTETTQSDTITFSEDSSTAISEEISIMSTSEANTLISASLRQPDENDCYMVGDFNISKCFYDFQMFVTSLLSTGPLNFESNIQHILSLSSILLLGKNRSHPDFKKFLVTGTVDDIIIDTHKNMGKYKNKFPRSIVILMLDIIQDVYQRKITKIQAIPLLMKLTDEQNKFVSKIILMFKRMIEDLPEEAHSSCIKEFELCSRYLQTVLQPLFDDSSQNVLFRWTNTTSSESRKSHLKITKKRPDGCITIIEDYNNEMNVGFAEVKTIKDRENHYKVNLDLYRLGLFSKNAIDTNKLAGALAIQAVGSHVTFYTTQLKGDGLYLMTEIEHLRFPLSLNELPGLLGFVDRLYDVLFIFEELCMHPLNNQRPESNRRDTLKSPVLRPLIEKTTNRTRTNYYEHYY